MEKKSSGNPGSQRFSVNLYSDRPQMSKFHIRFEHEIFKSDFSLSDVSSNS